MISKMPNLLPSLYKVSFCGKTEDFLTLTQEGLISHHFTLNL